MTPRTDLAAALRAHAAGVYSLEAAADLLIGHASWLHRCDFTTPFINTSRGLCTDSELSYVNWEAAITALDTGNLPCSGGEGRMLRLAASLADGIPVDLRDALTGLDADNINLVAKAVLYVSGRRQ
jgi:hypothetical protein